MMYEVSAAARAWRQGGLRLLLIRVGQWWDQLMCGIAFLLMDRPWVDWDVEHLIEYSFTILNGFIRPSQVRGEIQLLIELLAERRPQSVVEIGTAQGGTLFLLCQVAAPTAKILSIDLPDGPHGGGYPWWKKIIYRRFKQPEQQLKLLRCSSSSTKARIGARLNGLIDLLFIDGDHSLHGVIDDYRNYSPMVRPGGWIVFHDIVKHEDWKGCEVDLLWKELQLNHPNSTFEIIRDAAQGWAGIGVLCKK